MAQYLKQQAEWTVGQWLAYIEQRSPQQKIKLGLARITQMAERLGLLNPSYKVITVAGTNGKGSTVNSLETIYHTAGYKIGSYTSPHLLTFNERIKLNLEPISDSSLSAAFYEIESHKQETELSYFEMATLAALVYFKQQQPDIVILEVGLGGRLDATNVLDADVAIITTIHYDHQEFLGHTLDDIGREKAGILREKKPFIYADLAPPQSILQIAQNLNVPMYLYGRDFHFTENDFDWGFCYQDYSLHALVKPPVLLRSAASALMACHLLTSVLPVSTGAIEQAMRTIFVPGRLQLEYWPVQQVQVLYDVSHNVQAANLLAKKIQATKKNKVHAVFSAMKDKDIFAIFQALKNSVDYWYLTLLDYPRAASADNLLAMGKKAGIAVKICYTKPSIAFNNALMQASTDDLIVVFGSFFTVSDVMSAQKQIP